jgi:hypothetical protein
MFDPHDDHDAVDVEVDGGDSFTRTNYPHNIKYEQRAFVTK